jgi:flagellar P-ring protein precursor FlgI
MRHLRLSSLLQILAILAMLVCSMSDAAQAETVRLKDLGKFDGWRENSLVGYGLVTGLAGTGDSANNKGSICQS